MLKLSTSYSKKVPVEGQEFSSQSFHAAVELELSDALKPEDVRARIHDTFSMVRAAVEAELNGKAHENGQTNGNGVHHTDTGEKASNRQIKYLTDLAGQKNISLSDLNARIRKDYGAGGLYDLTRKQASDLLDAMNGKRKAA